METHGISLFVPFLNGSAYATQGFALPNQLLL